MTGVLVRVARAALTGAMAILPGGVPNGVGLDSWWPMILPSREMKIFLAPEMPPVVPPPALEATILILSKTGIKQIGLV